MAVKFNSSGPVKPREKYPREKQPTPQDYKGDPWHLFRAYFGR